MFALGFMCLFSGANAFVKSVESTAWQRTETYVFIFALIWFVLIRSIVEHELNLLLFATRSY